MSQETHQRFPVYPDHSKLLEWRDADGTAKAVSSPRDWDRRRAHILAGMQQVMGPLPTQRPGLDVQTLSSEHAEGYERQKISYRADAGEPVPAYLLIPNGISDRMPAMICLHQTTNMGKDEPAGLGGKKSLWYAHELAQRGYVCLVPDYPSLGEYAHDFDKDDYQSGTMKGIWNHTRGIDLLTERSDVDPERVGAIGHSLGGHNAMFLAAFDTRVKAIVSSCGFTAFCRYYGGDLAGWSGPRYMPKILTYGGCKKVPFDFHEIVGSFAPRAFLAVAPLHDDNFDNGGAREVLESAGPVYRLFGAEARLVTRYPDTGHDFPDPDREAAYAFLDRWLRGCVR